MCMSEKAGEVGFCIVVHSVTICRLAKAAIYLIDGSFLYGPVLFMANSIPSPFLHQARNSFLLQLC